MPLFNSFVLHQPNVVDFLELLGWVRLEVVGASLLDAGSWMPLVSLL